jgi:hypothetical protein
MYFPPAYVISSPKQKRAFRSPFPPEAIYCPSHSDILRSNANGTHSPARKRAAQRAGNGHQTQPADITFTSGNIKEHHKCMPDKELCQ